MSVEHQVCLLLSILSLESLNLSSLEYLFISTRRDTNIKKIKSFTSKEHIK